MSGRHGRDSNKKYDNRRSSNDRDRGRRDDRRDDFRGRGSGSRGSSHNYNGNDRDSGSRGSSNRYDHRGRPGSDSRNHDDRSDGGRDRRGSWNNHQQGRRDDAPKFDRGHDNRGQGEFFHSQPQFGCGPVPFLIPRNNPMQMFGSYPPMGLPQIPWGPGPHMGFDQPMMAPPQQDSRWNSGGYDDRGRKRDRDDYGGHSSRDDRYTDYDRKRARVDDEDWKQRQEGQRLSVARNEPNKIFLEDVNLTPEFAFRVDSRPSMKHLDYRTLNGNNSSRYEPDYRRDDVYGATEEELNSIPNRSRFSRCIRPVGIDDDGNPVDDDGNLLDEDGKPIFFKDDTQVTPESAKKNRVIRKDIIRSAVGYISVDEKGSGASSKILSQPQKKLSVRDQVEAYNVELRQKPNDIELWRKFVRFQDQVLEQELEDMGIAHGEPGKRPKGKFSKRTAAEKKVAILERAIELNPKSLELHTDRMEILYELYKPRYVLGEWKKLVTLHQQLGSFWIEYLMFPATQLQLYSSSSLLSTYEKAFQKFRLMFNPSYPVFQRPEKFPLLISDLFTGLTLVLRNSGFMEKVISFHQAQLEINFNYPHETLDTKADWTEAMSLFGLFWDAGTLRFGELGAPGWSTVIRDKVEMKKQPSEMEQQAIEWEDSYLDHFNGIENQTVPVAEHWISIESLRNTFQWLPWRENYSAGDSDDSQRMVVSSEITPTLTLYPSTESASFTTFDRQAYYFRSVMNFILCLRDDFLPRTQTLDCILSSFFPTSLTSAHILLSEIHYWQTHLSLYGDTNHVGKTDVPEGFDIPDYITCNPKYKPVTTSSLPVKAEENLEDKIGAQENAETSESLISVPSSVQQAREKLEAANYEAYHAVILRLVQNSIQFLDSKFASLLVQSYIRFQQRSSFFCTDNHKQSMKIAKTLLQDEKLRNSLPLYGEIAMLEYFGSQNIGKCSEILLKTVNSASGVLRTANEATGEVNIDEHWEAMGELTKLYRMLAELSIKTKPLQSLRILTALGNNFQTVELTENPQSVSKNELMIARRRFEKVLNTLIPSDDKNEKPYAEKWDGNKNIEYLSQQTSFPIEWISAYALFTYISEGFGDCCAVFEEYLPRVKCEPNLNRSTKYSPLQASTNHIREQLYIRWCNIGFLEVTKDSMQNGKLRSILASALEEFPASPPLLTLFCEVETQSSIAGKIWRLLSGAIKNETSIISLHWASLFMALSLARKIEDLKHDEEVGLPVFGLGGPAVPPDTIYHKLDAVLATAEQNASTRSCPLIWRLHFSLTARRASKSGLEKDKQAAKGMFYDAIRYCPSVKVLFMDALSHFPEMMKEVLDLMSEKQISIRLPVEELNVLLEKEDDADADSSESIASEGVQVLEESSVDDDKDKEVIEIDASDKADVVDLVSEDNRDEESVSEGEIID